MRTLTFQALHPYLNASPLFKKEAPISEKDIEIVKKGEERLVQTIIDGKLETSRMAKYGDLILKGHKGEKYVSSIKSFEKLHARDPHNPTLFIPQHKLRAVLLKNDFIIKASWGEDMVVRAGGVAVLRLNDNVFYGNQADTFEPTYWRATPTGNLVCPMTIPLEEQLALAEKEGSVGHKWDIEDRMRFRENPHRPAYFQKKAPHSHDLALRQA